MVLASMEIIDYITWGAMLAGFIALIWGIQNINKNANGRIVMIAGAVVVFVGVAGRLYSSFFTDAKKDRVENNEIVFLQAKAEKAASYIAERFPEGGSVGFLIDETSYNDSGSDNRCVLDELQKRLSERGFSCEDVIIVGESKQVVDKKTGEESTEIEDPTNASIMEKKLKPLVDKVEIVINFVGLPESLNDAKLSFLTRKNTATGRNNMMLLCDTGLPFVPQDMLKKGRVCAIIDYDSGFGSDFNIQEKNAPKELSVAFDLRYYFVNADSLDSFASENPNYFIAK